MNVTQSLTFLGRGSAFNVAEKNTSAFMKIGSEMILLDCGETVFSEVIKHNVLDDVTKLHVFVTHTHSDHIGSLSSLIYYCKYVANVPVIVYSKYSDIIGLLNVSGHRPLDYTWEKCDERNDALVGEWSITSFDVDHVDKIPCSGYYIVNRNTGYSIYYSGDTNMIHENLMICSWDEVYHEVSSTESEVHLSYSALTSKVSKNRNRVFLMHFDDNFDTEAAKKDGFKIVSLIGE